MLVDFIAGLCGGAAGMLVGHPFDTVKVHLQTDNPRNPKYTGTFHCFKTILLTDNVRGLYRGISSPLMGIGLVNAIVFGVYGNVQRLSDNPNSLSSHFWAGAIGGLAQSFICAPMELAKTRLQLSKSIGEQTFKGPIDCLLYIRQTEGIRGCFKGLVATILRDIPGFSSYFLSYEFLMTFKEEPSALYTLSAGGFAGMASWIACYPIDVVKTQMQADLLGSKAKYRGFSDCAVKIYQNEGALFFFRGLNSTLIRAFPMNAACFFVVSWIFDFCRRNGIDMIANPKHQLHVANLDHYHAPLEYDSESDGELVRKIISGSVKELSPHRETSRENVKPNLSEYCHREQFHESQMQTTQHNIENGAKEL